MVKPMKTALFALFNDPVFNNMEYPTCQRRKGVTEERRNEGTEERGNEGTKKRRTKELKLVTKGQIDTDLSG